MVSLQIKITELVKKRKTRLFSGGWWIFKFLYFQNEEFYLNSVLFRPINFRNDFNSRNQFTFKM